MKLEKSRLNGLIGYGNNLIIVTLILGDSSVFSFKAIKRLCKYLQIFAQMC